MVPQTLAVNFLRLASFSSLPPPVGMVLARSLYIAGVIREGVKGPPPPPPPLLHTHTHTHTHYFFTVIFSVKYYVARPSVPPWYPFSNFLDPLLSLQKECIMVKPPVCDVWSGRLQESSHAGGGAGGALF